jgi:hypothetical protein
MTTPLLDGPGRTLECINPKFMVDLVQGWTRRVILTWDHNSCSFVSV